MSAYTQILMQYETPLPDDYTMDQVRNRAAPEALYRIVGFDPFQWQFIDLTVWRDRPEFQDASHRYALVHVSVPGI